MKISIISAALLGPAVLVAAFAPYSPASAAAKATCSGRPATIVADGGVVRGTSAADVIVVKSASTVFAGAGNDLVCGSAGADTISGGAGADVIFGREGADTISGGAGPDALFGDIGADKLRGNAGDDELYGGGQIDTLIPGSGTNVSVQGGTVITIDIAGMDLQNLRMTNQSIAFAAANPSTPGVDISSTITNQPMMRNQFVLSDSYGVHLEVEQSDGLRPGLLLRPNAILPAPASGQYPVIEIGGTAGFGSRVPGAAGVSFVNEASAPVTVGLTGEVRVNGSQSLRVLTAVNLKPGTSSTAPAPTTATLYISSIGAGEEVVDHAVIAAKGVTVPLKSGNAISVVLSGGKLQVL